MNSCANDFDFNHHHHHRNLAVNAHLYFYFSHNNVNLVKSCKKIKRPWIARAIHDSWSARSLVLNHSLCGSFRVVWINWKKKVIAHINLVRHTSCQCSMNHNKQTSKTKKPLESKLDTHVMLSRCFWLNLKRTQIIHFEHSSYAFSHDSHTYLDDNDDAYT